ncbi:predicted protein [Naegleria gruberi]|uniref:Predicted protein n=1 Tax=Naegleria gruberi TaxID=5762 RepID=D2UZG3_NAEGR|nr:uncharacterized protein NAEGRDRAFT_61926 [Naegleria gruberi]EFC49944.1 predicted protein [Naegleria gruberi]|eukprot:XP_002682688.1 predicted protein [Naegleria gruberi strain NEG-M]
MDGNNYYSPTAQSPGATYASPHYVSPSSYTPGGVPMSPNATSNPFQPSSHQQQLQESLPSLNQPSSTTAKREKTVAVVYICGHCAVLNTIKQGDAIRCKNCGYRIMYKQRTTRSKCYLCFV